MQHASRTHRKYAASAMSRNMRCTAAPAACANAPKIERPSATEGTRAHEVLEYCLRTGHNAAQGYIDVHEKLEEENADAVQVALDFVRELVLKHGADNVLVFLEGAFDVVPGVCGGTSDVVVFIRSTSTLHVVDYKNGWEIVEVADEAWVNEQPLTYALGALKNLNLPVQHVVLTIIQPHPWHVDGPVRSVRLPVEDVLKFESRVLRMIDEAEHRPTYRPGKSACRWCDAKPFCPAVEQAVAGALGVSSLRDLSAEILTPATTDDVGRLASILATEDMVKAFYKSVNDIALDLHKKGQHVPGKKLVQSQTKREYYGDERDIAANIVTIAPNITIEELFESKIKPIGKVEDLIAKRVRATKKNRNEASMAVADANRAFAYLLDKKGSGKLVLADWDDSRPEVKLADLVGTVQLPLIEGPRS